MLESLRVVTVLLAAGLGGATAAQAQVEIEIDPIAYALNGFSLHAANVFGSVRVNLGTFGIDVPRSFHRNDGWDLTMRGGGLKVDYLGGRIDGFFAGIDGGYARFKHELDGLPEVERRNVFVAGVRAGYRYPVGWRGLYVVPWVGVGYSFSGEDVTIDGRAFESRPLTIFPTIHLGWRF